MSDLKSAASDHARRAAAASIVSVPLALALFAECRAEEVETVVVTAARREQRLQDVPAAIAIQDVEQLSREGFAVGTDELRGVPGIFFRRGEGDSDEFPYVSIRGSSGTEGYLAMIDGVPFMGLDEEPLLSQVPYDALERVEIVKGPVSALYGRGALYGAVNYITRRVDQDAARVAVSAGADDYYRVEGMRSASIGAARLLLSASYENSDGWREHSNRELLNLFSSAAFTLGERTTLKIYANYADRNSQLPNSLPLTPDGEVVRVTGGPENFLGYGRPRNDQQVLIGVARLEHRIDDNLTLAFTAQGRRIAQDNHWNFYDPFGLALDRHVYSINGFAGDTRQNVWYGETSVNWSVGRHEIVAGVSGERSRANGRDRWSGQFGFTPECGFAFFKIEIDYTTGAVLNADHPCFVREALYTSDHFTNTFAGAFIQDEVRLTDRLFLTLGGRYDRFRRSARFDAVSIASKERRLRGRADAFSPKAALSWRHAAGQMYFSYGRGFNSNFGSTFEWDAAQYARPDNRPSTLDSYELGWKGAAIADALQIEAAIFHTQQRNRRVIAPNPAATTDPTAAANLIAYGQRYDSQGAELSLRWQATDRTMFTLNYTYLDPEWKEYETQGYDGMIDLSGVTPVGVPSDTAYFAAEHRVTPWLSARAALEIYDDYAITQDNSVSGGGYELLTLSANITPASWTRTSLDVAVTNALDERYYFYFGGLNAATYATPGVPRQWRVTLRTSF